MPNINDPKIKERIKSEFATILTLCDAVEKQKNGETIEDKEIKEMLLTNEEILSAKTPVHWFTVNRGKMQQIFEWLSLGIEQRDEDGKIVLDENGNPIVQVVIDISILGSVVRSVIAYALYSSDEIKEFKKIVFAKMANIDKENLDIPKIKEELFMLDIQKVLMDKHVEMYNEFLENKLKDFNLPSISELFEPLIELFPVYMAQQIMIMEYQQQKQNKGN